ncbi:MAG: outer membrane lipoprotein carrier protein LolA [Phycisphaerales bacterium]|jgi:hypothetical protein|nr:outer membrane lipoprotein carrier protein LolA [Phycisphaerales bacterium]MBT7171803.1 outer membrane lipoprotein carrier protein LolA [Phycisphaerales bacterium]
MTHLRTILTVVLLASLAMAQPAANPEPPKAPCCPEAAAVGPTHPLLRPPSPPLPTAAAVPATKFDPLAMKMLQALELAGKNYPVLTADVNYNVIDRLTGDEETRTGSVAFQNRTLKVPARFAIRFETLQLAKGKVAESKLDYIFDGHWLHIAKHRQKTVTRIEVVRLGQEADVLKIGKGPFPLPFGQKADDVIKLFEVTTRAPRSSDPKNSGYLRLVPRAENAESIQFTRMELWIDTKTFLPVKVKTRDKNKAYTTATFSNIKKADKLADTLFKLKKPAGYTETREPLAKPTPAAKPTPKP